MTTPGPTAERTGARQVLTMSLRERGWPEDVTEVTIKDVEAAAVARHVRETGCEGLTVERLAKAIHAAICPRLGRPCSGAHAVPDAAAILAALASPATEEVERG